MLLVVSPHLDDAVLSVGAALALRARAGTDVVIATVCSSVERPSRLAEDAAAARLIGAHTVHLGILDAPLRGVGPKELCEMDDDDALTAEVARALWPWASSAAELWGPLGVGRHIDHRATHRALASLGCTMFYEDRPYARRRGAVGLRWQELGATAIDIEPTDDSDAHVHFADMLGMIPLANVPLPRVVRHAGETYRRQRMLVDRNAAEVRMKAIDAYGSQRHFLVGSPRDGGWPFDDAAEMLWSLLPPQ
jgi:GlcNAc-PI de-N-acetylase